MNNSVLLIGMLEMDGIDSPLGELPDKKKFIQMILDMMAKLCGGASYFCKNETFDRVVDTWVSGLSDCIPRAIIETTRAVLDCKYCKRDDYVPRTVIDFKYFIKHGPYNSRIGEPKRKNLALPAPKPDQNIMEEKLKKQAETMERIKNLIDKGARNARIIIDKRKGKPYNPLSNELTGDL